MIVSVDPGLRTCGVAWWRSNGELNHARLVKAQAWKGDKDAQLWLMMTRNIPMFSFPDEASYNEPDEHDPEALAIELPQVYARSKSKGDPNDLIQLAAVVGAFVARVNRIDRIHVYRPREWKGQVPKDVMTRRIQAKLSKEELARVELPAKSLQHNVWDAIGIGQHYFKKNKLK